MEITEEKLQEAKEFLKRLDDLVELGWLEGARQVLMILLPEEIFDSIDPLHEEN